MDGPLVVFILLFFFWIINRVKSRNDRFLTIYLITQPKAFLQFFWCIRMNYFKIMIE